MLSQLKKSDFAKNIFTLFSGTAIAQVVPFLLSPILARLYSPDDFAVLALFMAFTAIISVISTLRFEYAIVLPKEERDAVNLVGLSFKYVALISLIAVPIFFLFNGYITGFVGNNNVSMWLYFIPVSVFLSGIYQIFNYWSVRQKTYKINSLGRVAQSLVIISVQIVIGYFEFKSSGLIIGTIAGQLIAAFIMSYTWIRNLKAYKPQVTKNDMLQNQVRYKEFMKINTPHAFIDTAQEYGVFFILTYYFSQAILGSYSFAFRLLKAPVGLIGSAIYQVMYQKASAAYANSQDIRKLILKMYLILTIIGIPVFGVLFLFGPQLFSFVFSEKWRVAGEMASIISPWLLVNFIVSPVSCVPMIVNKQKGAFYFTIVNIIIKFGSIIIGGIYNDYKLALLLMSSFTSIVLLYSLFWYYKIAAIKRAYN